jgi:NAD(P)-dependent dehydrogenase (short-subunit alcohol dehydrogenase family)
MQLKDKIAVVTGGTRGIGFGIAKAFLDEGATVVITGRSQDKGDKALAELGRPTTAVFVACDATDRTSVDVLLGDVVARFGRIDILVNNVGGATAFAPIAAMDDQTWEQGLLFNVTSAFYASRKALGSMLAQKSGRIINISSVEGKHGKPFIVQYVTAKHALNGFTKGLSKEVAPEGITVNALCPGLVVTDLVTEQAEFAARSAGITTEQFLEQYAAESASKRVNTVEEVAVVAVLLASDAGSGINGAMISVDGGTAAY